MVIDSIEELYGKTISDKRSGTKNIHSWDLQLKGEVNKEQRVLLEKLITERRKKKYAHELRIRADGIPLTLEQISIFYPHPQLKQLLENLVDKGYLTKKYPKEDTSLEKGYDLATGQLSFPITKILNPYSYTPTIVPADIDRWGIIEKQEKLP